MISFLFCTTRTGHDMGQTSCRVCGLTRGQVGSVWAFWIITMCGLIAIFVALLFAIAKVGI